MVLILGKSREDELNRMTPRSILTVALNKPSTASEAKGRTAADVNPQKSQYKDPLAGF